MRSESSEDPVVEREIENTVGFPVSAGSVVTSPRRNEYIPRIAPALESMPRSKAACWSRKRGIPFCFTKCTVEPARRLRFGPGDFLGSSPGGVYLRARFE